MKISVIIPAYNAQKSISRLIESLLSQTLKEFEILLIDDGSTDGTAGICDEYASKHTQLPTIKVFHKKNEGVAMARQLGIDNACGEYSIHADTDDWVEPTMLEEMYNKAVEENADVVICDFYANDGNMENYIKQQPDALDHISILHGLFQQLHGSCWNQTRETSLLQHTRNKISRRHQSLRRLTDMDTTVSTSYKNGISTQSFLSLCSE